MYDYFDDDNNKELSHGYPELTAVYNDNNKYLTIFYCGEIEAEYGDIASLEQAQEIFNEYEEAHYEQDDIDNDNDNDIKFTLKD